MIWNSLRSCWLFLRQSLYRALAVLELTLLTRLAVDALPLAPSAVTTSVHQHSWLLCFKVQHSI